VNPDASTSRSNWSVSTGCASIGLLVTLCLRVVKASCCRFVHVHMVSFRVSSLSGRVLRHGRDVHPAWVIVVTAALATKVVRGQVTRAEIMLR
jgi:hypothetical protein